jgi:hypothetical protein
VPALRNGHFSKPSANRIHTKKGGTDMAAPKFSTSPSKSEEKQKRRFTLAEANRSLPLVGRIVRDVVNSHERATQIQSKIEESAQAKETLALQAQLDGTLERLQDYVDELTALNIELKDYETGLIDFPGRHQGRDVFLCWKLGEEKVGHWHELHAGFSGRQPASKLQEG